MQPAKGICVPLAWAARGRLVGSGLVSYAVICKDPAEAASQRVAPTAANWSGQRCAASEAWLVVVQSGGITRLLACGGGVGLGFGMLGSSLGIDGLLPRPVAPHVS